MFHRSVDIAGVDFDHQLNKRQVQALTGADVARDTQVGGVFRQAGIADGYSDSDGRIRALAVATLVHPLWEAARRELDSMLLDLTITPTDDFEDPKAVSAALRPACIKVVEQHCDLGESQQGLRHRNAAGRFLGFADQLAPVPQELTMRVAALFRNAHDFAMVDYSINFRGQDLIRPLVPEDRLLVAGWHPDPWAHGEYRRHDGEKWKLEVIAYGQSFVSRVAGTESAPAGEIDTRMARLYRQYRAWMTATNNAVFEQAKSAYNQTAADIILACDSAGQRQLLLAAADLAQTAKFAVSPDDEGDFGLPMPPVPAPDELDLGYRMLDGCRRWVAVGNSERSIQIADAIVGLGPEMVANALERAVSSAYERGEKQGWNAPE